MRCEEVKALLNDLIDGELDEERKAAVEAHIRSCANCAREKRRLERVVSLVRGLPREKVPVDLLPSLRASRVGVGLRRLVAGLATVAAALLVAILIMPLLKEGVVTEKAAKPFVGPPPVAPEAVAKKSPPAAHAKANKEAEKKSALQTGRVVAENTEPYEGKKLHPPEKEKELAKLKQDSAGEGWHRKAPPGGAKQRSGVEKREAVAAAPEPASPPARPAAAKAKKALTRKEHAEWADRGGKGVGRSKTKALDNALGKSQRSLGKAVETKAADKLLKDVERLARRARLEEMMEQDEKMLRKRMRRAGFGGEVEVVLFKAWVSKDAVEGLMRQINAVAEADESIMKTAVKRGKNWIEVKLTADKRGARIIRALVAAAPKGNTLFIVRFCYR